MNEFLMGFVSGCWFMVGIAWIIVHQLEKKYKDNCAAIMRKYQP